MSSIPPFGQEGDLTPNESHVPVLRKFLDHVVQNVFRLAIKVAFKGTKPAGVIVGMWDDEYF